MTRMMSALALLCVTAVPVAAAPATPEGAAGIEAAIRTYVGQAPGVVSVVPKGESYALTLDPAALVAMAAAEGLSAEVTPMHLTLSDLGEGRWGVAQDEPMALSFAVPGLMSQEVRIDAAIWGGTFDSTLMAFTQSSGTVDGLAVNQTMTDPDGLKSVISYSLDRIDLSSSAVANPSGGVDGRFDYVATGFDETVTYENFPGTAGPLTITLGAKGYEASGRTGGLRTEGLYVLLAWFVAHPSQAEIDGDIAGLKTALRGALPFWTSLEVTGALTEIAAKTPWGDGSAESLGFEIGLGGAIPEGRLSETVTITGLQLPAEAMPGWVPPLVPSELTLSFAVTEFDLAAPARLLLDELEPGVEPGPDFDARLLRAFLPTEAFRIDFAPGNLLTPTYSLDFEGGLAINPEGDAVTGRFTLGASGIEVTLEALNAAPEDVRTGAIPVLMMARGMAKPVGVGRFVWDIELTEEGKVLVNGIDMSALANMQ